MAVLLGEPAVKQLRETVRYVHGLRGNDPAKGKHKFRPRPGNDRILVQLTAALTSGSSAAGEILYHNGSSFVSSGQTVTVWDQFANPYVPSSARVWCEKYSGVWVNTFLQVTAIGKLDGALSASGSQTVSVWYGATATTEADTGENISGVGGFMLPGGTTLASGSKVAIQRSSHSAPWYAISSDVCPA